jgi:hypothetical protein
MGYHLTILRTEAGELVPISTEQFGAAVLHVPALHLDDDALSARLVEGGSLKAVLTLDEGTVWTNVADAQTIAVMLQLAHRLDARVRGDEWETYRSPTETYVHPDDSAFVERERAQRTTRARKRFIWKAVRAVVLAAVTCLMIVNALHRCALRPY